MLEQLEDNGNGKDKTAPSDGSAGVMSRRSKTLFGVPVPIHASQATDHGVTPATVTKMGEKVLVHTSFRPKVPSESERVTFKIPASTAAAAAPNLSLSGAILGGASTVFKAPDAAAATAGKDRKLSIVFANPTQTVMSHNKVLVYSYRLE